MIKSTIRVQIYHKNHAPCRPNFSECFRSIDHSFVAFAPWKCLPCKSRIATGCRWVLQKQKPCDNLQRDQKCFVMVLSLGSLFLFCLLCLNAVAILNQKRFLAPCKRPARTFFEACAYIYLIDPFLLSIISQMDLLPGNLPSNCTLIAKAFQRACCSCLSLRPYVFTIPQIWLHEPWTTGTKWLEEKCNAMFLFILIVCDCISRLDNSMPLPSCSDARVLGWSNH